MQQIKKFLQITIFIAILCIIGFYGSLEVGEIGFKEAVVKCALSLIYAGLAGIAVIRIEQKEKRSQGVRAPRELDLINISRK